mmetsp:Transcript_36879/g.59239  ORF Transcript_36879/g.59239 Transcript_36879/m.59239 type:complete len:336 (+) Transcript_36879:405-1412(+)
MADEPLDDASALVLLVETNPWFWESAAGRSLGSAAAAGLDATLRQLLVFVNAYLALHQQNRIAVIAMHSDGCHYLYASPVDEDHQGVGTRGSTNKVGGLEPIQSDACAQIVESLSRLAPGPFQNHTKPDSGGGSGGISLDGDCQLGRSQPISDSGGGGNVGGGAQTSTPTPLAAALSMATCYCNRLQSRNTTRAAAPRVLCVAGSEDHSAQYIAVMNAIFSAQRAGIPVDSCLLGDADSAFLQQAAHITGGLYYKPRRGDALVQYLLSISSADCYSRKFLKLPNQRGVDFRASCFCHKRPVDTGWVCSVCLSIFCQDRSGCPTCGADFLETLRMT